LIFNSLLLKTDFPSWFILVCFLVGGLYAFILYSKKTNWTKNTNRILAAFRFVLVTLLCFLLMGPLLNQVTFFDEKPVVVLAVDNSASVPATYDSLDFLALKKNLSNISAEISAEGYELRIRNLQDYQSDVECN
jgi:glucan phosphoethanolaminetransferase (alkaline phosphatase superfamily)